MRDPYCGLTEDRDLPGVQSARRAVHGLIAYSDFGECALAEMVGVEVVPGLEQAFAAGPAQVHWTDAVAGVSWVAAVLGCAQAVLEARHELAVVVDQVMHGVAAAVAAGGVA